MKKYLLTSLLAVFAVSSANAAFEFSPYIAVRGGYDIRTNVTTDEPIPIEQGDEFADGWMAGGAFGATFYDDENFAARIEAEYIYTSTGRFFDLIDATNHTALLNLVGDIKTGLPVTPYVTAGIGYGWTELKSNNQFVPDADDNNLAWQLGAGLTYTPMDGLNIDLGYRYLNNSKFAFPTIINETTDFEIESHQVYLGLRYAF